MLDYMRTKEDVGRPGNVFRIIVGLDAEILLRVFATPGRYFQSHDLVTRLGELPASVSPRPAIVEQSLTGLASERRQNSARTRIIALRSLESRLLKIVQIGRGRHARGEPQIGRASC